LKAPIKHHQLNSRFTIGFDVWGTILDLDRVLDLIALEAAEYIGGVLPEIREKVIRVHGEARKLRRRNPNLSPQALLEASKKIMAEAFNTSPSRVDEIIRSAFERAGESLLFPDVPPTLSKLSEMGFPMGIIGNVLFWPSNYTRILLERTGVIGFFGEIVFSDEAGFSKPDRQIFLYFAEKTNTDPSNLVYVGDNVVEDVGGVLSAGGFGVLISRRASSSRLIIPDLRVALVRDLRELIEVVGVLDKYRGE
jgi:putative hydrolase of the HAD superfamily